jgi:membrane associated rhomboid family serine protease
MVNGDPLEMDIVFLGSNALCREYSLMLEARGIEHEIAPLDQSWALSVAAPDAARARDEIHRYSTERSIARPRMAPVAPMPGAWIGGALFTFILLLVAYAAGVHLFDIDWLNAGALSAGPARSQWWRAITAVTLHLDQLHLLSNVLAGLVVGAAASQLLGPGIAWSASLGAAALGNYLEMWIAPVTHQAVGASSLVFAALGLVTGLAWNYRFSLRERRWYRWAPLIMGATMLTLFGAGGERVDVLGHLLGFLFGTGTGWLLALADIPRSRAPRTQWLFASAAVLSIAGAWFLALTP